MIRIRSVTDGLPSAPFLTTHYFETSAESVAQEAYAALGDFWEAMSVAVNHNANINIDPVMFIIDPVTGNTTGTFLATIPLGYAGGNTGDALPAGVSPIMQLRTGSYLAGREVRGRTFLPGLTQDQINIQSGTLNETSRDYLSAIGQALVDADLGWCVWSRKNGTADTVSVVNIAQSAGMIRSRRP